MKDRFSNRRLEPLGRILNLMDDGWTVWDCAPIWGEDNKVHVFATRWRHGERADAPDQIWFRGSEIIHAVADKPEGPYEIRDIVLQGDGGDCNWDSSAFINPKIYRVGEKYVLLYTGCTAQKHNTQAIGMLTASSLDGPWRKVSTEKPLIAPEPDRGGFDGYLSNNPALLQHPNGQLWIYYKGRNVAGDEYSASGMRIGLAIADKLEGPYHKHPANPLIDHSPALFEDPYVWHEGGIFLMLASDCNVLSGHGGLLFESQDGLHWSQPVSGYPGAQELLGREQRLEEPNLLFKDGRVTHLFNVLGACPQDPVYSGFVSAIISDNDQTPILSTFRERLRPAPSNGGFRMDGYYVWCGSVVRGDDGLYHMFASRWPHGMTFSPHWLTNSEIVRAVSQTPAGPYQFQEVVLPPRGAQYWDGRTTHNPTIHRASDGTYLLFYTGTTYEGPEPTPQNPEEGWTNLVTDAHRNQRIGLATAPAPHGPWTRSDAPILEPRLGNWDALMTTNPAPCVLPDGRILLIYKSVGFRGDLLRLGVAIAENYDASFVRLKDEPILRFDESGDHVGDPYVWNAPGGGFEMIMKDMKGGLGGETGGGLHLHSQDGVSWELLQPPQAYSRSVVWESGDSTTFTHLERPQLLIQNGQPVHLFAAVSDGPWNDLQTQSWNLAIPLRTGAF